MKTTQHTCPMSGHTATPWRVLPTVATGSFRIGRTVGFVTEDIAQILPPKPHATVATNCRLMKEHAEFIVRAVNSHAELLQALTATTCILRALTEGSKNALHAEAVKLAQEAIAKASGQA